MEWDAWSAPDIMVCTKLDQLLKFEEVYGRTVYMKQSSIVNQTGCLPRCSFAEYKLTAHPLKYNWEEKQLNIRFSSSDAVKRTEQWLYPVESFVSEFGGALGLYLGFFLHDGLGCTQDDSLLFEKQRKCLEIV